MMQPSAINAAILAAWASSAALLQQPVVRIVSPGDAAYVSGPTLLAVAVEPRTDVATVTFFVDGKQVCDVVRFPFQCDWDAGGPVIQHQIRAVVTFRDGHRVSTVWKTKGTGYSEVSEVSAVQVTASVTRNGQFVHGLPPSAFRVYEDGVRQNITGFSDSNAPLDLIVGIDVSTSMTESMPQLKAAVKEFLVAVPAKDRVTLLGFSTEIFSLAQNATSIEERVAAVDRLEAFGTTALYDVLMHALGLLDRRQGRNAIVIFTDGEDRGSHASLEMVQRRIEESDTIVYAIAQGKGRSQNDLKEIMKGLTTAAGGRAIFTERVDQLRSAFGELLEEIASHYLLGYVSTNEKRDGSWRRIKVEVNVNGAVRARPGYRARSAADLHR